MLHVAAQKGNEIVDMQVHQSGSIYICTSTSSFLPNMYVSPLENLLLPCSTSFWNWRKAWRSQICGDVFKPIWNKNCLTPIIKNLRHLTPNQGQATHMDWTLQTDLWKSETSKDIKKPFWYLLNIFKSCILYFYLHNLWRCSNDVKMIFWYLYWFQIFKDPVQCGSVLSIPVAVLD